MTCLKLTTIDEALTKSGPKNHARKGGEQHLRVESKKFPKVVRRGRRRSFGPREQKASCTGAKWGCTGKGGCGRCKRLFRYLCSLGPRDLLHPLVITFGNFILSTPSCQAAWFPTLKFVLTTFAVAFVPFFFRLRTVPFLPENPPLA